MVRFKCEDCSETATTICLLGYSEKYLCEKCICQKQQEKRPEKQRSLRRLAELWQQEDDMAQPLVCSECKIAPGRVYSPSTLKVYCWRCNGNYGSENDVSLPKYLVIGIPLKTPLMESHGASRQHDQCKNLGDTENSIERKKSLVKRESCEFNHSSSIKSEINNDVNDFEEYLIEDPNNEGMAQGIPFGMISVNMLPHSHYSSLCTSDSLSPFKRNTVISENGTNSSSIHSSHFKNCEDSVYCDFESKDVEWEGTELRVRKRTKTGRGDISINRESSLALQKSCSNCGTCRTPQWRVGPQGQKTLCNACGVKYDESYKYKAGRLLRCFSISSRGRGRGHGRGRGRQRGRII